MIQRHFQCIRRPTHPIRPPSICLTCTCRCGAAFANPQQQQQQRSYARKAPTTISRAVHRERKYLTPEQARKERLRLEYDSKWLDRQCQWLARIEFISAPAENAIQFVQAVEKAMSASGTQIALDPEVFHGLLATHGVSYQDAEVLSRVLLRDKVKQSVQQGKYILYSLSRAGFVDSTIRVMGHAYLESRRRPAVLNSKEIAWSREHLRKVANDPGTTNYRAMVLEGKVALQLKNEEYAIKMFNKAMAAAVAASEQTLKHETIEFTKKEEDPLELTAPWHELMQVHLYRWQYKGMNEKAECEAAMQIGCEQDDPVAHQFAADYVKRWETTDQDVQPVHIGTSDWLYHITKAATSGVPKAAHDLGVFYAESGWKYIEDEPPDHVKPTPFDSYPASKPLTTSWNPLHLFGLKSRQLTPQERMFRGAIFPHTAVARLKMAMGWLNQAVAYNYAPSCMMMARLYNRKTLWAQADAPKEALQLSGERYTFASKEDFERGRPISSRQETLTTEEDDPPNPFYDIEIAKSWLCEVFAAHEAYLYEQKAKKDYQHAHQVGKYRRYVDDDEALDRDKMIERARLPPRLGKWFKFPEVRELNGEKIKDLYEEAKAMCKEEGWVLFDEAGGLVYKPGIKDRILKG